MGPKADAGRGPREAVGPRVVRHDRNFLVAAPVVSAGSAGNERTVATYGVLSPTPRYARGTDERGRNGSLPRGARAAYAAGGRAFLFAAPSFYWASGGTVYTGTLDPGSPRRVCPVSNDLPATLTGSRFET
jgi:hypothetical protein